MYALLKYKSISMAICVYFKYKEIVLGKKNISSSFPISKKITNHIDKLSK